MHELPHALGFQHEQSKDDRDKYVRVTEENLLRGGYIDSLMH